jgi:selenocysteine lyase/cysteine desulfurase
MPESAHPGLSGAELLHRLRSELVGIDVLAPTLSGERRRYVNFDNAASTPTFRPIMEKVDEFLGFCSNVHRGQGFKSQLASWASDTARRDDSRFVRATFRRRRSSSPRTRPSR